jgi:lipid-binding SYLF domain-containing protein
MKALQIGIFALVPALMFAAKDDKDSYKRISEAGNVFNEIMAASDKSIPQDLLERSQCVGIVPNMKRAGFIVGAKYGKGVLVCRTSDGSWSAPETIRIEGGSIGFQIGAGETDLIFVVMNKSGQNKLLKDQFTFGGDASVMAGPVGRSSEAQTDAMMHAEILSYSRARGVFAGLSLEGSTMRPDKDDNREIYGREVTPREILTGSVSRPAGASTLYAALDRYTPARGSVRR